jgi:peptide-methionine (R)-S-oxide reductase
MPPSIQKTDAQWRELLAAKGAEPLAFQVTRQAATERPFTGRYETQWANGVYRCICCEAKLFESCLLYTSDAADDYS